MPPFIDLFGMDRHGNPRVSLEDVEGEAKRDIILPVCYRNTPWALTVAHALGFGIYRKEGLVQHFDDFDLWEQIGYEIVSGALQPGHKVVLKRRPDSSPSFFADHISPDDAIRLMPSGDEDEQAEIVAADIAKNIASEELDPDDHLVIFPYAISAKRLAIPIVAALQRRGVASHVVGATSSQDEMMRRGSVAIAHIHRAKGNEAPMVYLLNCQDCALGGELSLIRNILFTAITRSRAWVRLLGWGSSMQVIVDEVAAVREANYQLAYKVPTADELKRMRQIHRDLSKSEKAKRQKNEKKFREVMEAMKAGELDVDVDSLPDELRATAEAFLAAFQ
jgi:superfamily I DNA and RNA helicase